MPWLRIGRRARYGCLLWMGDRTCGIDGRLRVGATTSCQGGSESVNLLLELGDPAVGFFCLFLLGAVTMHCLFALAHRLQEPVG